MSVLTWQALIVVSVILDTLSTLINMIVIYLVSILHYYEC